MAERNTMRELSNSVCIVGVDESDEIGTLPHKSQLALHLEHRCGWHLYGWPAFSGLAR
jgi:hypothetical protein